MFVSKYDKAIVDPVLSQSIHRVAHYLCSETLPHCLGGAMRAYAGGGPMSSTLRTEVTAYQLCMLDDGSVESPHACVGAVVKHSSGSSVPWWSASLRLEQNIASKSCMDTMARGRFAIMFRSWKALGQHCDSRHRQMIPRRMKDKPFLQFVYRTGQHNMADWSSLVMLPLASKSPGASVRLPTTGFQQAKIEYIKHVCQEHQCFSVPHASASDAIDSIATMGNRLPAVAMVPFCFKVITADITRKRHVHTAKMSEARRMSLPAVVQRFTPWSLKHWPCDTMDLLPEGVPEVIDLATITEWDAMLNGLRKWSMTSISDTEGCWEWSKPLDMASVEWSSDA